MANRYPHPLCLCICDIDNFKNINDAYGHQAGDMVISSFSQVIRSTIRGTDIAGRYGGDEYCIIFPNTNIDQAVQSLERVRKRIAEYIFRTETGAEVSTSGSFGLAVFQEGMTPNGLFALADKALSKAKQSGKNRVET
jgi:diguanylate cyclase (GGDEF)-like protein